MREKPHPYDVGKALWWAEQGFPISKDFDMIKGTQTIIDVLDRLLPSLDPLYCFGTKENYQALKEREDRIRNDEDHSD